ncbi:MAG: acyl-CoA dehydrogenase family protein [Chloroflexi bacterium]|nr:acyl-CoA dehydrogenase family protein [Chloroflexota bacterium]
MNWNDDAEQAAFRNRVSTFIEERLPDLYRRRIETGEEAALEGFFAWYADRQNPDEDVQAAASEWAGALAENGWVAPHWPEEYGGAGLTAMEQVIFNEEMARAQAPAVGGSGVALLGPTVLVHGTPEQKEKYVGDILSGKVAWAQGYSEPGAGSDLGGLQTRAMRDGDEYVVNGQKIWTSAAHMSDAIFALVRTNPDAPKHRGISFIMIDNIRQPGINVRPLIDAAWGHVINEVFFEDVRVPVANVLGEENRGWYVGMTLLDFERSGIAGPVDQQLQLAELLDAVVNDERSLLSRSDSIRDRIADRYISTEISYNLSLRVASMQAAGLVPNYEASMGKMFASEQGQELHRVGVRAFGLHSQIWPGDGREVLKGDHIRGYIRSIPSTIAGGSSEVQRNIIATRGLGLPRG